MELQNGSGFIFKNVKKDSTNPNDKKPDYVGNIKTANGEEQEISLWVKSGTNGKYFSVSVRDPFKPSAKAAITTSQTVSTPPSPVATPTPPSGEDEVDDLPF